ncbi:VanZ family protein [Nocardioides panacisoli]|uniref:VanZ-like domain-containing protein n=1 Tax=Nocardioides panacisoli TaxID=627624 RepID=A0ABP7IVZ9_9ACTN
MLHRHPLLSAVTGVYLVFLGWLTLTPQDQHTSQAEFVLRVLDALHRRGHLESLDYNRFEFLANIALFVPAGMFLLLLLGAGRWWLAALLCFATTAFIESAQHAIPGRVPDDRDLLANSVGAVLGIAVALVLTLPATLRRSRHRRAAADYARAARR